MIVSVGELMWDLHVEAGSSLETGERLRRVPGGAAANVARSLARRGRRVALAGVVADDALGRGLCEILAHEGIDTSRVVRAPGRTGLVFLERGRPSSERFVSYRPTVGPFMGCELPAELDGLHLAALNPISEELEAFAELAARARHLGAWVMIDVNARKLPWTAPVDERVASALRRLLSHAHVIKASDGDLARLTPALGEALTALGEHGATVFVTRAAESTLARGPWGDLERRPPAVALRRSVGAGDAFSAGLLGALLDRGAPSTSMAEPAWTAAFEAAEREAAAHVSTEW